MNKTHSPHNIPLFPHLSLSLSLSLSLTHTHIHKHTDTSRHLNRFPVSHAPAPLPLPAQSRYPFANRLTLRYDPEVMEEVDGGPSNSEERARTAGSVLAAMGAHDGIKTCCLDYWDYVLQSAMYSLLSALPSLESLEIHQAFRLDLEMLLLPGITGLTSLVAKAEHILMAPDMLRSAPVLTQLRDLRLSQLQVNDQPSDNLICQALGTLTSLTRLELVTFSAATRQGMVALKGIHNETLRPHPLARLPSTLGALSRLRVLLISDEHMEKRTANAILGSLTALTGLEELVMPEARTREEGWAALQQLTSLTWVHLYSIELKGQARAKAPGSITWWRRLRLEDTCLPELAAFMPVPGLETFIATFYMRYGEEPMPPKDFAGMDRVMSTLGAAREVRLWLDIDCDIWAGLSQILGRLPGLAEVVVRAYHPHPLESRDLAALVGAATQLQYLDLNNSAIDDEGLLPLGDLQQLKKVCLGLAAREGQEGHTPEAVKWLAKIMAGRRQPSLIVAPHLLDCELEDLEAWQSEDPVTRGSVTVAEALPDLELPPPGDPGVFAGPFFRSGAAAGGGRAREAPGSEGWDGPRHGMMSNDSGSGGTGGIGPTGLGLGVGSLKYSFVDPDDALVLLSNNIDEFYRRVDL
ncbi:hypothetical protein Vretimale_6808 [Volvox reticuliferus]|uniref:Uncharacterized protein n=1 Tax=Volvox reticuliferus TaxID=1737510 RepID=A0A8J4FN50_9CHLO|nr:hypothetical protein Vretifemale_7010 [Volvox reticuliferus]GIM02089.1 hypothetical protein Vretimale_6808 [Volvox reticuliferus]